MARAVLGTLIEQLRRDQVHARDIATVLESLRRWLADEGIPFVPGLRKSLRETEHQVDIDVVTAGEHAGSPESPVEYPPPDSPAFVDVGGLRLRTLAALATFKIASGIWGHRGQELVDVQRLIRANGLTESFADRLPPPLREKFLDLLRESRLERRLE